MKFKKLKMLLATTFLFTSMSVSVAAANITPPTYPDDYKSYNPYHDPSTSENNQIPGWGYIGFDAEITPNPDPSIPPTVDPEDATKFIHVEVPIEFIWAAFVSNDGNVVSPTYEIVNNNDKSDLHVTLESFKKVGGDALPSESTLVLNLTGDLELSDILSTNSQNHNYSSILNAGGTWIFGINGTYTGRFPSQYVQPRYEMVLNFAIDSINP